MVITTLIIAIIFAYIIIAIVFSLNIDLTRDEIKIYSQPNATVAAASIINAANISTVGFRETLDPLCYMQVKGLTTEQVITLADSAYYYTNDRKQLKGLLFQEYFGSDYVEDLVEIESPFPHALNKCSLCHYQIKSLNLTVFSIRGTKTMTDVLADVELWIGTVLIDAVMKVTPLVQTFALSSKAVIGSFMSLPRYIFHEFSLIDKYVGIFENYINSVNITNTTDALIVGHSLGGGLARILSLKTGMQAVAVSGPGISCVERYYYNHYKNIEPTVISINPRMDIVAMVDNFDDLTEFKVPCKSGLFKCHSVARTLCQTGLICGNGPIHEDYCGKIFPEKAYKKMKNLAAPINFGTRNG
ncbi:hypothetical protein TVAG_063640 [Trichomonas vaginalis G3]|uniref:Fungal lipase-like domain-containing protein n=1 Tax=Trichomonas vaginalis (strain ATCC PRA-98 / G3) TaxID=412133 RepID=A2EU34_TRIV3|nr:lipase (class 3) family [Trichomonas vaginalis G3]EAY03851.1 hypothetical protein TVAG_063640 [Trichomonas vaginalis G3]KAI5487483.1 lipase (class 3) family [Trichomonas vaginalis G3]|eukprot:XP_001316074.1 hypothetical protein [Trichomonas vaginalis G3]